MTPPASVEPVVLWRYPNCGQWLSAPVIPGDVNRHPSNVNYTFPYRALPLGAFDALLARLREAEARVERAEGDVTGVDDALRGGADESLWPPGKTRGEAIAAIIADRDQARADLADLSAGRLTIHELIVRNGKIDATFGGEMVQEIGLLFVDAYRKAGAVNYLEMTFHGKTEAGELERFTMTIQRVNGKTPHECRVEAERERDAARAALNGEGA